LVVEPDGSLNVIEEKFDKIQGADIRPARGDLWIVDQGEKGCNAEFCKFIENNMFASKRLNLFVV